MPYFNVPSSEVEDMGQHPAIIAHFYLAVSEAPSPSLTCSRLYTDLIDSQ